MSILLIMCIRTNMYIYMSTNENDRDGHIKDKQIETAPREERAQRGAGAEAEGRHKQRKKIERKRPNEERRKGGYR